MIVEVHMIPGFDYMTCREIKLLSCSTKILYINSICSVTYCRKYSNFKIQFTHINGRIVDILPVPVGYCINITVSIMGAFFLFSFKICQASLESLCFILDTLSSISFKTKTQSPICNMILSICRQLLCHWQPCNQHYLFFAKSSLHIAFCSFCLVFLCLVLLFLCFGSLYSF